MREVSLMVVLIVLGIVFIVVILMIVSVSVVIVVMKYFKSPVRQKDISLDKMFK